MCLGVGALTVTNHGLRPVPLARDSGIVESSISTSTRLRSAADPPSLYRREDHDLSVVIQWTTSRTQQGAGGDRWSWNLSCCWMLPSILLIGIDLLVDPAADRTEHTYYTASSAQKERLQRERESTVLYCKTNKRKELFM